MCSDGIQLWFLSELHQYKLGVASNFIIPQKHDTVIGIRTRSNCFLHQAVVTVVPAPLAIRSVACNLLQALAVLVVQPEKLYSAPNWQQTMLDRHTAVCKVTMRLQSSCEALLLVNGSCLTAYQHNLEQYWWAFARFRKQPAAGSSE